MALRFFLMRTHYRSDVNHSDSALEIASDRVYYIFQVDLNFQILGSLKLTGFEHYLRPNSLYLTYV
jgi:cysteinyl-tRNA synthetase